jgi:acyl-CoA thioesterase-2
MAPHGIDWTGKTAFIASLDHAMWFHDEFRADEWLLYDQHSPWAGNARGLAHGSIYTRDGRRVCSVVQEGLIRQRR